MSINDLPEEVCALDFYKKKRGTSQIVIENILSLLSPSDRRKSTLISRRFAEVFSFHSSFMDTVWLNLSGYQMDDAQAVISDSNRQFKNLRICEADLFDFNPAIWTKLGTSLRKLELIECFWSPEVFYSILLACPNLESLAIHETGDAITVESFELPSGMSLQNIQKSTRNLRHLYLKFGVNADLLEHVLVVMPSVSSIALSTFEENSDFLDRLPSLLGTSRGITMIDWRPDIGFKDVLGQFLRIASTSLLDVRIPSFSSRRVYEALECCTELRHLEISLSISIDDSLLQNILRNTPKIEVLMLSECCVSRSGHPMRLPLSHAALMPILKLTKLRKLHLWLTLTTRSDPCVSNEFLRNLGGFSSLESLHLSDGIGNVDDTSFQNFASLRNLRDLKLGSSRWDANSIRTFRLNLNPQSSKEIVSSASFS